MRISPVLSDQANTRADNRSSKLLPLGVATLALWMGGVASASLQAQTAGTYNVTNIVSDGSVPAITTDPNFINPWGVSASPNWWISAQATGFNYVVPAAGTIAFKVIVPASSGLTTATGLPAGSVTTAGATGMVLANGTKASFIFSTLDGTISGWNGALGTANAISLIAINNSAAGASYPGLALLNTATASYLLAPNFGTGRAVEVYDSKFAPAKLAGSFTDPNLPANYAPFSVHVIGTQVYVAYAVRTATAPFRTVDAVGNGIVSIFDTSGNFVARAVTGGSLDTPWGVAIAPANFGIFGGSLLIGNFGNGRINAYDPKTFAYRGQLTDGTGKPLTYASLWELLPGGTTVTGTTSVSGGDINTVYFSAGLTGETHGLFAGISNNPTATGTPTFGFSSSDAVLSVAAGSSVQTTLSVAPTNNFSGTVALACSGLPVGATCSFGTSQVAASASAAATTTVTINTVRNTALLHLPLLHSLPNGIVAALMLPFASIVAFFRRRSTKGTMTVRLLGMAGVSFLALGVLAGCGGYTTPATPYTPAGSSQVTITATSGAVSQSTTVTLTVQ